ncbi:hypothetical protein [Rubrolithibacter danxiaensis]|uniref:hypothetical protein n=1 Tax=Rubrolithibacter danxiaensis TaxID=3390805 RepID=UPI003BF89118
MQENNEDFHGRQGQSQDKSVQEQINEKYNEGENRREPTGESENEESHWSGYNQDKIDTSEQGVVMPDTESDEDVVNSQSAQGNYSFSENPPLYGADDISGTRQNDVNPSNAYRGKDEQKKNAENVGGTSAEDI